jgi:hypothetical protein
VVHAQGLSLQPDVEFVPLVKYASDVTPSNLETAKASGKNLLCFNEPDYSNQGNLTVSVSCCPSPHK